MDIKKKIAIILGAVWLVLILARLVFSPGSDSGTVAVQVAGVTQSAQGKTTGKPGVSYPALKFSLVRKDLFSELASAKAEKKTESETKKIVSIPAPPLPLLPEEPKQKKDDKPDELTDSIKDIVLLGVMDRKEKKIAFLKKMKDIKSVVTGDQVFNTPFFVEKIGSNMVILKDNAGQKKTLEIVKEVKDEKK